MIDRRRGRSLDKHGVIGGERRYVRRAGSKFEFEVEGRTRDAFEVVRFFALMREDRRRSGMAKK